MEIIILLIYKQHETPPFSVIIGLLLTLLRNTDRIIMLHIFNENVLIKNDYSTYKHFEAFF